MMWAGSVYFIQFELTIRVIVICFKKIHEMESNVDWCCIEGNVHGFAQRSFLQTTQTVHENVTPNGNYYGNSNWLCSSPDHKLGFRTHFRCLLSQLSWRGNNNYYRCGQSFKFPSTILRNSCESTGFNVFLHLSWSICWTYRCRKDCPVLIISFPSSVLAQVECMSWWFAISEMVVKSERSNYPKKCILISHRARVHSISPQP